MIGIGIFASTMFVLRCRKRHRDVTKQLKDVGIASLFTGGAFVVVFLFHALLLTPKVLVEESQAAKKTAEDAVAKVAKATPPPITIDFLDAESRKQIQELKQDLSAANETIRRQRSEVDPLGKPIASARFTIVINFDNKKEERMITMSGAFIYLGAEGADKKGTALLWADAPQRSSDGECHSRLIATCPFDAPYMGKPIRALAEALFIQIEFADDFVPIDTELEGGQVVLVLNEQVTLNFSIPAQVVKEKLNDHPAIIIKDIQDGLSPLLTPPS